MIVINQTNLLAQLDEHFCDIAPDTGSVPEAIGPSYYGEVFTPKGELRVLTIFAGFDDGPGQGFDESQPLESWSYDSTSKTIPNALITNPDKWMYDDVSEFGNGEFNLSEYFYEMSLGQFKFYGDILKDSVTNQFVRVDIDPAGLNSWGACNNRVIQTMQQLYPNFDWSPYDNRENWPNFQSDNSVSSPDNKPDYVIIIYRYSKTWGDQPVSGMQNWVGSGGAYSVLNGINVNYNGYTFDNAGFTLPAGNGIPEKRFSIFLHELAHELYSSPHQNGNNSTVGYHWNFPSTGWGMMGSTSVLNYTASGWDRWMLGWIDLETGINQDNSDIKSANDLINNGIYTLRDFVTTGDVIRIKIPHTNNQYVWLENHQNISQFDYKEWAGLAPSPNGELIPEMSYGLYMYKESIHGDRDSASTFMVYDNNKVNGIYLLNAQGNYDYERSEFGIQDWNWFWNSPIFNFKRKAENPLEGYNTYQYYTDDFPNPVTNGSTNGTITYSGGYNTGSSESYFIIRENDGTNDVSTYASTGGVNYEAENLLNRRLDVFMPDDEVGISGIVPLFNYPVYFLLTKSKEPYIINGLTIKVLSQDSLTGSMTVQIIFDDIDMRNDKRWTGNLLLPEPSAGTTYSLNVKSNVTLLIDKSGTPNRNTQTINNDFINPTVFTCSGGSYFHLEQNSDLFITGNSTLILKSGSKLELEDGAELFIHEGELIIEDGAELILHDGAKLIVDTDGKLTINNTIIGKGLIVGDNIVTSNQAEVIINGTLTFASNAIWVHKKSGFYNFASTHTLNLPSTVDVTFTGLLISHKMLELQNSCQLTFSGNTINWSKGLIHYGLSAQVNLTNADFSGTVLTFTGPTSSQPGSIGLNVVTPTKMHLFNSTIEKLQTGVKISNATVTGMFLGNTYIDNVISIDLDSTASSTIAQSHFSTSNPGGIGIKAVESFQVNITATTIIGLDKGAYFYNVDAAYINNNSNISYASIGIEAENTLLFVRGQSEIHQNTKGVAIFGNYNYSTNNYSSMLTIGDVGCGAIYDNAIGVYGRDAILNIDAIEHSINSSGSDTIPNRFDNNSTYTFDICYTDYTVAPSQINAKMNYWGGTVIPTSNYRLKTNTDCIAKPNHGINIPLITSPHSTCTPTPNCANCAMTGGGGTSPGGPIKGLGLMVINAFQTANEPFVEEDNLSTREGFTDISSVGLLKDTTNQTWQAVTINNDLLSIDKNSVHRIQVAKAIKAKATNSNMRLATAPKDIFSGVTQNANELANVQVYPNPVNSELTISIEDIKGIYMLNIYQISGKLIIEEKLNSSLSNIDVSSLENGIYFYEIISESGERLTGKVSVVR